MQAAGEYDPHGSRSIEARNNHDGDVDSVVQAGHIDGGIHVNRGVSDVLLAKLLDVYGLLLEQKDLAIVDHVRSVVAQQVCIDDLSGSREELQWQLKCALGALSVLVDHVLRENPYAFTSSRVSRTVWLSHRHTRSTHFVANDEGVCDDPRAYRSLLWKQLNEIDANGDVHLSVATVLLVLPPGLRTCWVLHLGSGWYQPLADLQRISPMVVNVEIVGKGQVEFNDEFVWVGQDWLCLNIGFDSWIPAGSIVKVSVEVNWPGRDRRLIQGEWEGYSAWTEGDIDLAVELPAGLNVCHRPCGFSEADGRLALEGSNSGDGGRRIRVFGRAGGKRVGFRLARRGIDRIPRKPIESTRLSWLGETQ